jgi:ribose/xylose/arabinose/galactoside ABC-type transport system permease subunit
MKKISTVFQLLFRSQIGPLVALAVIVGLFALADFLIGSGNFLTLRNVRVITSTASLIAVPALGMTLIIIAGGIDLSAGTALTLCGTVLATLLKFSPVTVSDPGFWSMVG